MNKSVFFAIFLFIFAVIPVFGATVHEVIITDTGYQPKELTICAGDTVRWVNKGSTVHSATSDIFDSGPLSPGLSFEYISVRKNWTDISVSIGYQIIEYGDLKNFLEGKEDYNAKINIVNSFLEISPRDSKFMQKQEIRLLIFFPTKFRGGANVERADMKLFLDETMIYEGEFRDLIYAGDKLGDHYVGSAYEADAVSSIEYIIFVLPPGSFSPGLHRISIEAEHYGILYKDSVTYTILTTTPIGTSWK